MADSCGYVVVSVRSPDIFVCRCSEALRSERLSMNQAYSRLLSMYAPPSRVAVILSVRTVRCTPVGTGQKLLTPKLNATFKRNGKNNTNREVRGGSVFVYMCDNWSQQRVIFFDTILPKISTLQISTCVNSIFPF